MLTIDKTSNGRKPCDRLDNYKLYSDAESRFLFDHAQNVHIKKCLHLLNLLRIPYIFDAIFRVLLVNLPEIWFGRCHGNIQYLILMIFFGNIQISEMKQKKKIKANKF